MAKTVTYVNLEDGKRRQSPVINIALAGAANAVPLLTLSTAATMVGIKTYKIKRLKIQNNGAPNTFVHIGTGIPGVDSIPPLASVANTTDDYEEDDIPEVEFNATITTWADAVGGGGINVLIGVEEIG